MTEFPCSQESGRTGRRICSAARRRPSATTCSRGSAEPLWTACHTPTCAVRRTAETFAGRPKRRTMAVGGHADFTNPPRDKRQSFGLRTPAFIYVFIYLFIQYVVYYTILVFSVVWSYHKFFVLLIHMIRSAEPV